MSTTKATTRTRKTRTSKDSARTVKTVKEPQNRLLSTIKKLYSTASRTQEGKKMLYILDRVRYLLVTLLAGFIIQYVWNNTVGVLSEGEYMMHMFEAAILWVCIY